MMETTQDRQIDGGSLLRMPGAWWPAAAQQARQLLNVIGRRQTIAHARSLRFSAWLAKHAGHISPMACFQPLNFFWYRPGWSDPLSVPTGKNLWRHEYVVRSVTVPQEASGGQELPAALPEQSGETSIYSPKLQIQSRTEITRHIHTASRLDGQRGDRPALILAVSGQPRKEISPLQYGNGGQLPASTPANAFAESQAFTPKRPIGTFGTDTPGRGNHELRSHEVGNHEAGNDFVRKTANAAPPTIDTTGFVNDLFDRAMQSQVLPGLDLQLLPLRAATIPDSKSPGHMSPEPAGNRAHGVPKTFSPPSVPFSREEVNRVADKVALVLKQRERFERERRGGY